jgi:uncharacterized linocin/CFP29 family protein
MNNPRRELAPDSAAAWASIGEEARRTFKQQAVGRRVLDAQGPSGQTPPAVQPVAGTVA